MVRLQQFSLLVWKNFILQKRRPIATIVELLLPLLFSVLLLVIRTQVSTVTHPNSTTWRQFSVNTLPSFKSDVIPKDGTWNVAYAPDNHTMVERIMLHVQDVFNDTHFPVEKKCPGVQYLLSPGSQMNATGFGPSGNSGGETGDDSLIDSGLMKNITSWMPRFMGMLAVSLSPQMGGGTGTGAAPLQKRTAMEQVFEKALDSTNPPQEVLDIVAKDASSENKTSAEYLTDVQLANNMTTYLSDAMMRIIQEQAVNGVLESLPKGMRDIIASRAEAENKDTVEFVGEVYSRNELDALMSEVTKEYINKTEDCLMNYLEREGIMSSSTMNETSFFGGNSSDNSSTNSSMDGLLRMLGVVPKVKVIGFASEKAFEEFVTNDTNLASTLGGIIFKKYETEPTPKFHYKIRLHSDPLNVGPGDNARFTGDPDTWETANLFPPFQRPGPRAKDDKYGGKPGYYREGFLSLMHAVDVGILLALSNTSVEELQNSEELFLKRFPYPPYIEDDFLTAIAQILPMLIMLSFFYTALVIVKSIVHEKETRMKEYLMMTGLSNWLHWLAWFAKYLVFMSISCVFITLFYKVKTSSGTVLTHTDPTIVFLFFVMYAAATISFCCMVSVFFSKANVAAAAGGVLFGLSYMPYMFIATRYSQLSWGMKAFSCLLSNVAMSNGAQILSMFEGKGTGVRWWNIATPVTVDDNFTFLDVIGFLLLDCILYMFIALYVEGVWPGEYGIPKPWYFPFTKAYWMGPATQTAKYNKVLENGCENDLLNPSAGVNNSDNNGNEDSEYFESDPPQLRKIVEIFGLRKVFNPGPKEKVAVDGLNLTMYEGQITVLLGHNGAGKTTTMSILTGLFPPSSGYATVMGQDITKDIDLARRSMGLCPQHNILFDQLTVEEHLYFFSRLKGLGSKEADQECEDMCQVLELADKRKARSKTLSGGMKRKLSVGLALCAGSKFIVLDEPTAGMDPAARRAIWDVLQRYRDKCSMLLSTHFMDEADLLGDRISIMADGKLRCAGSSVFLKNKFGVGYHVVINKSPECDINNVNSFFVSHVPLSRMERTSAAEISFLLPFESSHLFHDLFTQLDENKEQLGILSYGASITTMEEVFLCVTEDVQKTVKVASRRLSYTNSDGMPETLRASQIMTTNDVLQPPEDPNTGMTLWMQQFHSLLVKKMLHSRRHLKVIISQLLVPVIFVIIAILNAKFAPFLQKNKTLDLSLYGYQDSRVVYNHSDQAEDYAKFYSGQFSGGLAKTLPMPSSYDDLEEFLSDEFSQEGGSFSSGNVIAATLNQGKDKKKPTIAWFNAQAYHSSANSLLYADQAYIRWQLNSSNFELGVSNSPLPRNSSNRVEEQLIGSISGFMIAFNVVMGFSFLAASFSIFIVRERTDRAALLQTLAGVDPFCFWLSAFVWDMVNFFFPCIICMIVFAAFGVTEYIHNGQIWITLLLFFLYCWSVLPLTYIMSMLFSVPATALVAITIFGAITGLATIITINVLMIIDEHTRSVGETLDWVFLVLPQYCIGQGLADLYTNDKMVNVCTTSELYEVICRENGIDFQTDFMAWERYGVGRFVFFMSMEGLVFFTILFAIEYDVHTIVWRFISRLRRNTSMILSEEVLSLALDEEVVREQSRINNTLPYQLWQSDLIYTKGLRKVYDAKKGRGAKPLVAVNNLSLGIPRGECFGLLGINGAGKTTTFKMLTGDVRPTSGTAFINGNDITGNLKLAQQKLGYCPQFDGLIEQMTGRETLVMYARLRGVKEKHTAGIVQKLANLLHFEEHIDKLCGTYSGGNKRKLSTAIALVGGPPVVLLDEPSTGMDPGARRKLWDTISQICTGSRSVIITSHSMEECEALCTRLAIMVNGQPRCLGGPQHLKNKFGQGYSVEVKMASNDDSPDDIKAFMQFHFPGTLVKDEHQGLVSFQVPQTKPDGESVSLAFIFGHMEEAKQLLNLRDYSVSQTTLEQVFLSFARSQREATDC